MKLTEAQSKVYEKAKKDIDNARSMDYPEWLKHNNGYYESNPKALAEAVANEEYKNYWEDERKGIVLTWCNSGTLRKLEKLGLIEIIYDSANTAGGIDTIKVLNY